MFRKFVLFWIRKLGELAEKVSPLSQRPMPGVGL